MYLNLKFTNEQYTIYNVYTVDPPCVTWCHYGQDNHRTTFIFARSNFSCSIFGGKCVYFDIVWFHVACLKSGIPTIPSIPISICRRSLPGMRYQVSPCNVTVTCLIALSFLLRYQNPISVSHLQNVSSQYYITLFGNVNFYLCPSVL